MIREGLIEGLVFGSKKGINYWESSPPPTETIYDQTNAADIDAFIIDKIGGAVNDYLIFDIGPYGMNDLTGGLVNLDTNNPLESQGGATDTASPHNRAIVADGLTKYWTNTVPNDDFEFGPIAFAIAVRLKITGSVPVGTTAVMGKGIGMHFYRLEVNSDAGRADFVVKSGIANAGALSNTGIADNTYRWILFGRSVVSGKIWIRVGTDAVESAFSGAADLSDGITPFGIWASALGGAGIACEVDHMLAWVDSRAENVYTNQAALVTEVFND